MGLITLWRRLKTCLWASGDVGWWTDRQGCSGYAQESCCSASEWSARRPASACQLLQRRTAPSLGDPGCYCLGQHGSHATEGHRFVHCDGSRQHSSTNAVLISAITVSTRPPEDRSSSLTVNCTNAAQEHICNCSIRCKVCV